MLLIWWTHPALEMRLQLFTHSEPQHPPVVHVIGTSFATDIALLQTFPQ